MKRISILYTIFLGAFLLASCVENEYPSFSDSDAFVAFDSKTASINEDDATGYVEIPVTLSSLSGIEAAIPFEVDTVASTAEEGVNFTLEGTSISFTKEGATQKVKVNIIDNDVYTGDLKLVLKLKENNTVNLGATTTCTITIIDNEHPLAFILGNYAASADSYFSSRGHFDWTISIIKDDSDATKVWICNLDPYFAGYGYTYANGYNFFYGFVNEEKTEILVPVGQEIGYDAVTLAAFNDPDPDAASEEYYTSGNMVIAINADGSVLTLVNAWGTYDDGFWNLFYGGIQLNKN